MIDTKSDGRGPVWRAAPWLAVLSAFALAACSATPDWANPVEWYKGATSVFDEEPAPTPTNDAAAEMAKKPIPGEGEPFPNLASVPARPRSVTPSDERKKVTEGLVADRANARYVDEPASTRATLVPGAEVTASPRPPVSSAPAAPPTAASPPPPPQPSPPPQPAPPPVASSPAAPGPVASAQPPPPPPARVAPPPAPETPPGEPGAPRSLGSLIVGPGGEVKSALPGDGRALPNTAVAPPTSSPRVGHIPGTFPMAVVLFNDGATQISEQQRQGLSAVVREANARGANIRVVGHASPSRNATSSGSLVNNFRASMDRAQSVASALIRLGVPPARVQVEADTSPDSAPDVANVPAGDAGLRRADIFLE